MNMKPPSEGERSARVGYEAQDKRAAILIYDKLIEGNLKWIKIADPKSGRVDDIQFATNDGEIQAFQVKWAETIQILSFADFIHSGKKPSLIAQLADGWRRLVAQYPDKRVYVHLVHRHIADYKEPSAKSKLILPLDDPPPLQRNFQAFIRDCWTNKQMWLPLGLAGIPQGWHSAMEAIKHEINIIDDETFLNFVAHSIIDLGFSFPEPSVSSDMRITRREKDIDQLARLIAKVGGGEKRIIEVSRNDLLQRLGWKSRFEYRSKHEFPVDEDLYQPITQTVNEIETAINQFTSGYITLIGTPGSGKSTILTQTLRYRPGLRVIHYYAYVPDSLLIEGRGEAISFLHDLHLSLHRHGIYTHSGNQSQPESLEELRNELISQLIVLNEQWNEKHILTLIVIDGLDHIEREQSPERSLLKELLAPASIPEGVLFILGSQTLELADLSASIRHHVTQQGRTITLQALSKEAVFKLITTARLPFALNIDQQEKINTLSNGHPLMLRYILEDLSGIPDEKQINEILNNTDPFKSHIEENYNIYWNKLSDLEDLKDLLALLSRMRGPFNPESILHWVGEAKVELLFKHARRYFSEETKTRWRFYHNSFRQYILIQTRRNILGNYDIEREKSYHRRLADFTSYATNDITFTWEELYHRFYAEDWTKVIQLGTQAYFRDQFMNLRPITSILEDIGLCLKAARVLRDGLVFIRCCLIEKELKDRVNCLDVKGIDLPLLLYKLQGLDIAMQYVMDGRSIRIDRKEAFEFAAHLVEDKQYNAAEKIFDSAEPLDLLNGTELIDYYGNDRRELLNVWTDVAHYFRSIDKIIGVIDQLKSNTGRVDADQKAGDEDAIIKQNTLMNLIISVYNRGDMELLKQIKDILRMRKDGDLYLRKLDYYTCYSNSNHELADAALKRLLQWANTTEVSVQTKIDLSEFIFHIRGDKDTAAHWIKDIQQPALHETLKMEYYWDDLTPFSTRIRLNRLLSLLGQSAKPIEAVPDDETRRFGGVIFERNLVIIANLWGQAWAGKSILPSLIIRELNSALNIFNRDLSETRDWTLWHSYRKIAPEYFTFLIHAVSKHGNDAIQVLGNEFDKLWKEQPQRWPIKWRRIIALELFHQGDSSSNLILRLDAIDICYNKMDDVSSRSLEVADQTFAWLIINESEKARNVFSCLFKNSFGIVSEKDYQFIDWIRWLKKATIAFPESIFEDIRRFACALLKIEEMGRGGGTQEAASDLMSLVAEWHPAYALQLKDWLLSKQSIKYTIAIEGILRSAIISPDVPIELVFVLTCHLFLPFSNSVPIQLSKLLAKQCILRTKPEEADNLLHILKKVIETKSFPSSRAEWWRGIIDGLNECNADATYFLSKLQKDTREKRYESDLNILLTTGERLSSSDVLVRITSGQTLLDFIEKIQEIKYFPWDRAIAKVISSIDYKQLIALTPTLKRFDDRLIPEILFAKRLKCLGHTEEGLLLINQLLERSTPHGWDRCWDGGSRLTAMQVLIEYDPVNGRKTAYDYLINDYLSEWRYPSSILVNLEEFLPVLFEDIPLSDIWREIKEHIYQLDEFDQTAELPPTTMNSMSWKMVLLQLVADANKIGISEIRDESHQAFCKLFLNKTYDKEFSVIIDKLLDGDENEVFHALAVFESKIDQSPYKVATFTDKLSKLALSPDIIIRTMSLRLADKLHISLQHPSARSLPAIYKLQLPEFPTYNEAVPISSLAPGESLPDINDPIEMVRPFLDQYKILSKISKIPMQNLINRAALLMKELKPKEMWNKQAEENLKGWLKSAGLELSYYRLRPQQALRALHRVISELADAKLFSESDLSFISHLILRHDQTMSCLEPVQRPTDIFLPESNTIGLNRDKAWLQNGMDAISLMPEKFQDGRIVLAELTRICYLGWEKPTEYRFSMICHPDWVLGGVINDAYNIFPYNSNWYAKDYPNLHNVDDPAIAIYGSPRSVELGGHDWLAFNPNVAMHIGWKLSKTGLFRWEDGNGHSLVESVWWEDGPIRRYAYKDDVCSEGWVVLADAGAQAVLGKLLGDTIRLSVVTRMITEKDGSKIKTVSIKHSGFA